MVRKAAFSSSDVIKDVNGIYVGPIIGTSTTHTANYDTILGYETLGINVMAGYNDYDARIIQLTIPVEIAASTPNYVNFSITLTSGITSFNRGSASTSNVSLTINYGSASTKLNATSLNFDKANYSNSTIKSETVKTALNLSNVASNSNGTKSITLVLEATVDKDDASGYKDASDHMILAGNMVIADPFEGMGTAESPFLLRNRNDFDMFSILQRDGVTFAEQYLKVQPDTSNKQNGYIDMLGTAYTPGGLYDSEAHGTFKGNLDGNNIEIKNLVISVGSGTARAGLIGTADDGAVIRNVYIGSGSSVSSQRSDAAGVVGFATGTVTISGCKNYASVYSPKQNGGIVANVGGSGNVTISNCQNYGTITGIKDIGGIVGIQQGTCKIENCTNNGSVGETIDLPYGGLNSGSTYKIVQVDGGSPSGEGFDNLTDGNTGTKYCSAKKDAMSFIIKVSSDISIVGFTISNANDTATNQSRRPGTVKIWGKDTNDRTTNYTGDNNGGSEATADWTAIYNGDGANDSTNFKRFDQSFSSRQKYNYYWIYISGTGKVQLSEFALIVAADNVGGIGGMLKSATTINTPNNTGTVNGNDNVGGIVGYADGTSSNKVVIDSSVNSGAVTGYDNVGGIVGGGTYASLTASATNSGSIKGVSAVGGIAGCAGDRENSGRGFSIANARNTGTVTSTGGEYVGGIAGYSRDTSYSGTISNENSVIATNSQRVGGVVGFLYGGTLSGAANSGKVQGSANVGGIVGVAEWGSINGATNSGDVSASESKVGGILGLFYKDNNSSNSSYISGTLTNTGCVSGDESVGGIVGSIESGKTDTFVWNATSNITSSELDDDDGVRGHKYVGGAIGYLSANVTIAGSISVLGRDVDSNGYDAVAIGGIVGYNAGTIKKNTESDVIVCAVRVIARSNSTTVGSVVYNGTTYTGSIIGGIVGFNVGTIEGATRTNKDNGDAMDVISVPNRDYVGGIAGVNLGTLTNCENTSSYVGLLNTTKYGGQFVGGVVGYNAGTVTNGKNTSTVNGTNYVGGLVGYNIGTLSIPENTINNATVSGTNYVGGFVGYTKQSGLTLANLTNNGAITGSDYVGGIVGGAGASTAFNNCTNNTSINGTAYVGGILGGALADVTVSGGENNGTISGTSYVGGIVGGIDANTAANLTITNSHNGAAVTSSYNNVGGLVGGMGNQANGLTITGSYNSGAITCTGSGGNVGGIVGRVYTTKNESGISVHIHNCYNIGNVAEKSGSSRLGDSVGGIVGYMYASAADKALVKYCYNYANIEGNQLVGGIVGSGASGGNLTINYCYVEIDDSHNVIASAAYTYGAIIGGAYNGSDVSNFSVANSWGFYANSALLSAHNTGASVYGAYLLNEFGKNVHPIIDGGQETDWTKIASKNSDNKDVTIESFYIESGISVSNGYYLALLKEEKSYTADTVKTFAKPDNIADLPSTVSTDGSVAFGVIKYSANTTATAWNIHVYSEEIVYTAPDMEYIKAHLGTDNPEYTKQGKSAYYTWNNDAIRDGYFGQFTLRSGDDVNVSEGGFTFDARIKIDGTDKIFGQKLNNQGDTIVARRLPVSYELLNATIMGDNMYRHSDFGLSLITISRLLDGGDNNKVLTIKKGFNSDNVEGGDVFVYSYNGEDVFTISGTFSATNVGTYTYTITIASTNYVFESAQGDGISTNTDTVKSWTYTITPYDVASNFAQGNVWFGANLDMIVTNNEQGTVTFRNGATADYYPLNATASERPQALIYQNEDYKRENFIIYVKYSTGEVAALAMGSEYTLSDLATAGDSHVNTGASITATGTGNFANTATKYYVVLDSDFGWTSADRSEPWGTASNPYVISTQAQLMRLSQILNGDKAWNSINGSTSIVLAPDTRAVATDKTYAGAYFVVTADADIVLDGTFKPICNNNENTVFKAASFASATSGQLVKISYYYNSENSAYFESRDYVGLFGNVQGTHFKDLYVVGTGAISGNNYVGGLVGYLQGGVIENCTFEGRVQISGNNYVGGLVGHADGTQILFDTSSTNMSSGTDGNNTKLVGAQASGVNYVGGIAGKWTITSASQFNGGNTNGLYFAGMVKVVVESTGSYAGAIAGMLDASGCADALEIKAISGIVNKDASAAQVSGVNYAGTLYGAFIGNGTDKTSLVYNENSVYGTLEFKGAGKVAGGFVGYLQDATLKFNQNYTVNGNQVKFNVTGANTPSFFGGIVGVLGVGANVAGSAIDEGNKKYIALQNSVNFGASAAFGDFVGGIIGYVSSGAGRSNMGSTLIGDDLQFIGGGNITAGSYVGGIFGAIGIVDNYTVGGDFEGKNVLVNALKNGSTTSAQNNNIVTFKPASAKNVASVSGDQYVGGIAGSVSKKALAYFVNSVIDSVGENQTYEIYNSAQVSGNQYVGGIVGYLEQESHELTRIVNIGKVGKAGASYVGGLVGYMVGGTIQNSVSAVATKLNENSDHYIGSENVGGLVGFMQGGTLENSISTGFKFDGYNTSNTKGGVVGNVLSANIKGSWTIYLATAPTYASVSRNGNGKYVLVDASIVSEVGSYANVLAMAGVCKESANPTYDKQGELRIGVNYPTKSDLGDETNSTAQPMQLAFYDASGTDSVMTTATTKFESANGVVLIGVDLMNGESYTVCKYEVRFSSISKYKGSDDGEGKLNAQAGYRAPSGADTRYRAEVTTANYDGDGNITRIIANIYFKDILVGSVEGIVGGYDSGNLNPGSSTTPLTISTQEEWNDFAWSIYTGSKDYSNQYVKLLTNITIEKKAKHDGTNNAEYDFSSEIINNSYNSTNVTDKTNAKSNLGYNMAGNIAQGAGNTLSLVTVGGTRGGVTPSFKGTFDGDGHTITIKYEESASRASVFPNAEGATFRNLTIDGYVKATGLSGGENDTIRTMSDYHILSSKSGNSATAGEGIYKINDGDTGSKYYSANKSMSFVAEFVAPLSISGFSITNGGDNKTYPNRTSKIVRIWGSNKDRGTQRNNEVALGANANTSDGWTPVYSSNNIGLGNENGEVKNVTFSNPTSYKYYWVYIEGNGDGVQLSEFGFLQGMGYDCAGFVGKPFGDLYFYNCKNMADISAYRNAAGILGFNDQGYKITLEACVNEGDITSLEGSYTLGGRSSKYSYDSGWNYSAYSYGTGGIIGSVKGNLTIQSCRNTGTIVGGHNVGGIIGCSDGTDSQTATLVIDSCANSGYILANSGYWGADEGSRDTDGTSDYEGANTYGIRLNIFGYAGGLVGRTGSNSILKMYASYNSGEVTCLSNMVGGLVGGVGYLYQSNASTNYVVTGGQSVIAYCYNIGEVSAGGTFPKHTKNLSYGVNERENDGGDIVGGIAGIVGNILITDCYNAGNITAYGITAYRGSWQLRAGGIVGQSEPQSGNSVVFNRCYNIGTVNSRHILNTMLDFGVFVGYDTNKDLRYGAAISGYCDDNNNSASRVSATNCYSIAYRVTIRVADQNSKISDYRSNNFTWYADQRNQNWLNDSSDKNCLKTGDLCTNYRDLTALMKSDASVNVPGTGWKTGNAYNNFNGTDTTFNLTASYASIGENLSSYGTNVDDYPSGWLFVYGCLPQLAVFAVDTYNGLSMRSVNYGRDVYGEYQSGAAGTEFSPYVIKDGIDLLGMQALVDLGYDFKDKYIEFADGTNNLEDTVSNIIDMPTDGDSVSANAYKYSADGTNYVGGKSYHLFARGAASDYTNWKAVNHAFKSSNSTSAGATFADQNFIPIGRKGGNNIFKGNISGAQADGNTEIANLRITYRGNAGLFGYVQDAEVHGITVSGNVYSYSSGPMQGNRSVAGGIVAYAYGSTTISGCKAGSDSTALSVSAYAMSASYSNTNVRNIETAAGGIVGIVNTASINGITYSYSEGTTSTVRGNTTVNANVASVKNNIGGTVGFATGRASLTINAKDMNNRIDIESNVVLKANIGALSASECDIDDVGTKTGGILGYVDENLSVIVRECVVGENNANESVVIVGENRIGGIVGEMPDAVGEIIGCKVYKSATIKRGSNWGVVSNAGESGTAIGGIVGLTFNAEGTDPITTTFSGNIVFQGKIVVGVATNYASTSDRSNDGVVRNVGGIVGDMGAGARIATGSEITVSGTIEISAPTDENHKNRNIGGVAGRTSDVAFSGSFMVAPALSAETAYQIGGFIGKNNGIVNILADNTTIEIGGNISASHDVGGFIGYNAEGSTLLIGADQYRAVNYNGALSIRIAEKVNDVEKRTEINTLIKASGDNVGGIVGNSAQNGYVQIVKGTIVNQGQVQGTIVNQGQVKGSDNVGGIIGINDGNFSTGGSVYGNATLKIVNEGKVEGNDYVGGVIGKLNIGEIAGGFVNRGNVSGRDYVGGSIGYVSMAASIKSTAAGKTEFVNEAVATAQTSDALVSSYASVADDSKFNVSGRYYVGGSIGLLLGSSIGNDKHKVEFRSKGTVNGEKYVGGSIGVLAGKTDYTDFISEGEMSGITATTAVGGSVGFIGVPNPLKDAMAGADIVIKNTHFEANGTLTLVKTECKPSAKEEYVWGGIGGAIGAIGNADDNLFDNTDGDRWVGNTYYASGNVKAEGFYHVGGIVGLIKADNITIANMLAYDTVVTGAKNVGGIVGATIGKKTVIQSAFSISTNIAGGVFTATEGNAGGIIGFARVADTSNGYDAADDTDASSSYWVKGYSNAELASSNVEKLQTTLGRYTLAFETWVDGGNTVTIVFTKELIGSGSNTGEGGTETGGDTGDEEVAIYPAPYDYYAAVGTHTVGGVTYTINADEIPEDNTDNKFVLIDDSWTWKQYFAKTNPNAKYVDDANAWVEEKANWTQYSTGTKQTGWYFVYANDQDDQSSIGTVSAVHAANIRDDETYWKRIADAYTRDERANDADTAKLTSLIVKDSTQAADVVIGGGEPEKGMLYATATSADFANKAAASGYYMYIASSGDEKPTAKHSTVEGEDKFFIRVETVSAEGSIAQNVAVYYRSIAMGSALTYNGYERYAPISLQKDIAYDTTIKDGATNLANQNKYFYNTINKAGEPTPKAPRTYHSTVNIYYFDDLGNAYIVGGINEGTWRINQRKLTFSATDVTGKTYGAEDISTTITVSNIASVDVNDIEFTLVIDGVANKITLNLKNGAKFEENQGLTFSAVNIYTTSEERLKGNDLKYNVESNIVRDTAKLSFTVNFKNAKDYKLSMSLKNGEPSSYYSMQGATKEIRVNPATLKIEVLGSNNPVIFDNKPHGISWKITGFVFDENLNDIAMLSPKIYANVDGDGADYTTSLIANDVFSSVAINTASGERKSNINVEVVQSANSSDNSINLTGAKLKGEYYLEFDYINATNCNYTFATASGKQSDKLIISDNTLTVSWSSESSRTYDKKNGSMVATVKATYPITDLATFVCEYFTWSGGVGTPTITETSASITATIAFETSSYNVGTYNVTIDKSKKILDIDCNSNAPTSKSYKINERELTLTPKWTSERASYEYSSYHQGLLSVAVSGLVDNVDAVKLGLSGDITVAQSQKKNGDSVTKSGSNTTGTIDVGTYSAHVTLGTDTMSKNYKLPSVYTYSWTITKRALTISGLSAQDATYDGQPHRPSPTLTGATNQGNGVYKFGQDTIEINYTSGDLSKQSFVNAATYTISINTNQKVVAKHSGGADASGNYDTTINGSSGTTFTINKRAISLTWTADALVFQNRSIGQKISAVIADDKKELELSSSSITGAKFKGYAGGDTIEFAVSGAQINAGSGTMSASIRQVTGTNADGSDSVKDNYVIVGGESVGYTIAKLKVSIECSGGRIADKVYDATVKVDSLSGLSFAISSTNGSYRPSYSDVYSVKAEYTDANVGDRQLRFTYTFKGGSNYEQEGELSETSASAIGTITPATIIVTLDRLRNGRATRTFAESKDGINVYYGGANGAINGQRSNRSQTYRLGEGFTLDGFPSAEAAGVVRVLAKYVEVGNGRSAFDGYVNYIYDSGSGVFVKGTATSDYVVNNNLFKALEFSIEDIVDGSGKSANYRFHVVDSSKETISGDADAQLGTNAKPVRVYDSADKKNENVGKQSLGIEITVKTYKIKYGNTTQSYANADGTYNTEWLPVEAVDDLPSGINVAVENGWRYDESGQPHKMYKEYTVIRGRQGSKELSASVSGQNGKQLNYNMTNQPVLTIGYFVETIGDVFEIGSLSSLMIASYYWWVSANSGNPEFNQVINTTVTWNTLISDKDYSSDNPPAFVVPSGAPEPPKDVTTWDAYFEWLETEKKITVFLNENENNTWGYYTTSTGAGDVKKYSSFKQVRDINGTFTQSDIEMLNGFFRVYDVANDQYVTKEWGKGGEFITNFLKVGVGNVAVAIGSIFKSLDAGFTGSYDGGGYVIEYFNIMSFDGAQNAGMFDVLGITASVKNVHLRNFTVTANGGNVGGIAGKALAGENAIENVSWHGTISMSGNGNVGGIVGLSARSIDKAIALGTITAKGGNIGGLIGSIEKDASASSNVTIANAVSFVYIDTEGNVGAIAGSATGASANNTFYLASSAWTRSSGTLTVSDGTLGIAKTYTQLIDGESAEGVVKAGSLSGYIADAEGKKYYQGSQKGVYDMLDDFNLADNANRTSMNARQSLRLKDIIDVYMLMYSIKEVDVKVNATDTETSKVYTISAISWLVNDKHGTDGDAIVISNRQHAALLRELRFASFILDADVVATATSGNSYAYGGAFFGKVTVESGKAYTIDFGGGKRAFEAYASGSGVPSKQNA